MLSQAELDYVVDAAIERWAATGLTDEQVAALESVTFSIEDLSGWELAERRPPTITIDADAFGTGWFIDGTPLEDAEFGTVSDAGTLLTDPSGEPAGQMDLLTTIMHELGHVLGLEDTYALDDQGDLMYG